MQKFIFTLIAMCIGFTSYASDTYKTQDILLLYKSCYETILFLGNTKYKGIRRPLKPEKVAGHCFCVCDKIRAEFINSSEFMKMDPGKINKVITPLSNECIKNLGPFWEEASMRDFVKPEKTRGSWQQPILV